MGSSHPSQRRYPPELSERAVRMARDAIALLEAVIRPGDRVCLEGDNQKQADLSAGALATVDGRHVHDLHMVQSGIVPTAEHQMFRHTSQGCFLPKCRSFDPICASCAVTEAYTSLPFRLLTQFQGEIAPEFLAHYRETARSRPLG